MARRSIVGGADWNTWGSSRPAGRTAVLIPLPSVVPSSVAHAVRHDSRAPSLYRAGVRQCGLLGVMLALSVARAKASMLPLGAKENSS